MPGPLVDSSSRTRFRRLAALVLIALSALSASFASAQPVRPAQSDELDTIRREIDSLHELLARGAARLEELEERLADLETPDAVDLSSTPSISSPPAPSTSSEVVRSPEATLVGDTWSVGYDGVGRGYFLRSPSGDLTFHTRAFLQMVHGLYDDDFERADAPGDFAFRRIRIGWRATWKDRYSAWVEIDGGPTSTPGRSDFALSGLQLTTKLRRDDQLDLVVGKFVAPFSTEDRRPARALDTIERSIVRNAMTSLPALDVQFGAMLTGRALSDDRLTWYAGVFNGNGRASDNLSDDNGDKSVQLKLLYRVHDRLRLGVGVDRSNEEAQTLRLRGLSFTPYAELPVEGSRRGWTADFDWVGEAFSFRGEAMSFDFDDVDASLDGGYLQGGWFLRGDRTDGVEAILRAETARIDSDRLGIPGDRIDAITLGVNLFYRGHWRLQLNAVAEDYHGPSNLPAGGPRVEGDGWKTYLLSQLQIEF